MAISLASLWLEIEAMLQQGIAEDVSVQRPCQLECGAEILRLECLVLRDQCESPTTRRLIAPQQAAMLRALIVDLLECRNIISANSRRHGTLRTSTVALWRSINATACRASAISARRCPTSAGVMPIDLRWSDRR
jgi:hypothetical protein